MESLNKSQIKKSPPSGLKVQNPILKVYNYYRNGREEDPPDLGTVGVGIDLTK